MRIGAVVVLIAATIACSGRTGLFRQYEYEEELYLSLDGRATIYVNASVASLAALRSAPFDTSPDARADRDAVRAFFQKHAESTDPEVGPPTAATSTTVAPVRASRRLGRPFVHIRVDVEDVRRLNEVGPFAWSSYRFAKEGNALVFHQTVGPPSGAVPESVNWDGDELVAFRIHVPSRVIDDNSQGGVRRGNILEWEQRLSDRLRGVPISIDIRMEEESILFRTLSLFAATLAVVALMFALIIWWVRRAG